MFQTHLHCEPFQSENICEMPKALTHDQCRREMCAACGGRAGSRNITADLGAKIRKWAQPGWSTDVNSFPTGICESCRVLLMSCEKQQAGLPGAQAHRWKDFKLEEVSVPRGQLASSCCCHICLARKSNSVGRKGFNNTNTEKNKIETDVNNVNISTPQKDTNSPCPKCFQAKTGHGIPHTCTEATMKKNLAELVTKEKGTGAEQIITTVLKDIFDKKETSKGEEVKLKQMKGGQDLTVSLGKKPVSDSGIVDAEVVAKLKNQLDLGKKETSKMLHILRQGQIKIEQNVMDILEEIGSTLEDEYENVKLEFEESKTEKEENDINKNKGRNKSHIMRVEFDVTIVKEAKLFIEKVIEARG